MTGVWTRNKNLKGLTISCFAMMLGSVLVLNFYFSYRFSRMNEESHRAAARLLDLVKTRYPDLREQEWIALLNQEGDTLEGQRLLERYGIFRDQTLSAGMARQQRELRWLATLLLVLVCGTTVASLFYYLHGRQRQIDSLAEYVRSVQRGNYSLELNTNGTDELSGLKNELYKVTVTLRESAEKARGQKKALADSVSDISHQLKTPLASVMILLDNLTDSPDMEEQTRRKFLGEITGQLSRVSWLAAVMLKLSRLDAGVVEFARQRLDIGCLLEQVTERLAILAEWKQVSLELHAEPGIFLTGDESWLAEALSNIVKNAIEHSPAGGSVVLAAEDNAVYTAVSVRDFGQGMTAEEQKHIFQRFYRSPYAGEDSAGIGLSLAKEIIERQNGYLTVDSKPGEGTLMRIRFLKQGS